MSDEKIVIVTPAPPGSRSGNRNTASRWARILRGLRCHVSITTEWRGEPADLLIALHARRSHPSLKAFCETFPQRPTVLALTGTDIYRDIRTSFEAQDSLRRATRFVVLQSAAPAELSREQQARTRVIYQSVSARAAHRPPRRVFRACVLGHLREEKDPFRAAHALACLRPDTRMEIIQAGKALSPAMAAEARTLMERDPRYRWVGELPHWRALRLLAASQVMIISSLMEGGAHVVSEAIAHGVPVIASDIPGNRGMLGDNYPAYFAPEDKVALAELLRRAISDREWLAHLAAAVIARRPLIDPAREAEAWRALLRELLPQPEPEPITAPPGARASPPRS